ncbi:COQ9 family protein [Maricaulaceae bacterium EIL42A08]|nr:COQ9 family protein [Maricaulaceae bacterium EIL42A08]
MTEKETDSSTPRADAVRNGVLDAALDEAAFDGWNARTLSRAAAAAGYSDGEVQLYCPNGVLDLIEWWSRQCDEGAREVIQASNANRIRDKVAGAVLARLEQMDGYEDAASRARGRLLLPDALDRGRKLTWATSDMIWRAIGDKSTDYNFYTKRTILSGVYTTTFMVWVEDTDPDKARTREFLDRRIDNVMQFEKVKAQAIKMTSNLPDLTGLASRLRYGFERR